MSLNDLCNINHTNYNPMEWPISFGSSFHFPCPIQSTLSCLSHLYISSVAVLRGHNRFSPGFSLVLPPLRPSQASQASTSSPTLAGEKLVPPPLESAHFSCAVRMYAGVLSWPGVYLKYIRPLFNLNKLTSARPGSYKLRHSFWQGDCISFALWSSAYSS